jgi:hypothetical protein
MEDAASARSGVDVHGARAHLIQKRAQLILIHIYFTKVA